MTKLISQSHTILLKNFKNLKVLIPLTVTFSMLGVLNLIFIIIECVKFTTVWSVVIQLAISLLSMIVYLYLSYRYALLYLLIGAYDSIKPILENYLIETAKLRGNPSSVVDRLQSFPELISRRLESTIPTPIRLGFLTILNKIPLKNIYLYQFKWNDVSKQTTAEVFVKVFFREIDYHVQTRFDTSPLTIGLILTAIVNIMLRIIIF